VSAVGEVRYERAYYYCRHCGSGAAPADAGRHGVGTELTPPAREAVALAGTVPSFAEAAEKVLPEPAGPRVSESTAERTAEAIGTGPGGPGAVCGRGGPWAWSKDARGRTAGYAGLDATGAGIQGPNGTAAEGERVDVGPIFDPGADARPGRTRAPAGPDALDASGPRMRRRAARAGRDAADVWVGLADGGNGLGAFLRVYFPRAEPVPDFYHPAEHLNGLAKALHPQDDAAAGELAGRRCHQPKHEGGAAVPATLDGVDRRGKKADGRERHRPARGHVRANVSRLDDPRYRADGWLAGSGHVESACKGVVGQRLKGDGMRRREAGAAAVCHVRALFKSEKGRRDAFWATAPSAEIRKVTNLRDAYPRPGLGPTGGCRGPWR
jgi:hypothetical protein